MNPKDADEMANSVDPDQTAPRSSLIWVCTVCPIISVRKLRIIIVLPKKSARFATSCVKIYIETCINAKEKTLCITISGFLCQSTESAITVASKVTQLCGSKALLSCYSSKKLGFHSKQMFDKF